MSVLTIIQDLEKLPAEIAAGISKEVAAVGALIKKDAPEVQSLLKALITLYNAAKAAESPVLAVIQQLAIAIADLSALTL